MRFFAWALAILLVCAAMGACGQPSPASPDAGFDAGPADAGTSDAGPGGAGTDGGAADAGGGADASVESIPLVPTCTLPPTPAATSYRWAPGLVYATMDGQAQHVDIAWPDAGTGPFPLVLLIHGGGWWAGNRTAEDVNCQYLASQGYVAATIDYRLADAACDGGFDPDGGSCHNNFFPAQAQDVRCAVRWLKSVAAAYNGDPSRLGVIGQSAGAHLVSLLGTESGVPGLDGPCPVTTPTPDVNAVAAYYAPDDLTGATALAADGGFSFDIYNLFGAWPPSAAQLLSASPEKYVALGDPPFLLLHGTADQTVPYAMGVEMLEACHDAGVPATLVTLPDAGHGFPVFSPLPQYEESSCTTLAFLKKYLQ